MPPAEVAAELKLSPFEPTVYIVSTGYSPVSYTHLGKRDLHDFFLGAHTLAGTRNAQTEAVAVEQQAAIRYDHVLADGVLPVVQTIRLHDFLRAKRNQHSGAFGGQRAQGLDFSQTIRQHRVQTVLLLPAQRRKLAQVPARRGVERFGVAVELLFAVSQMHERHQPEHHSLVDVYKRQVPNIQSIYP